MLNISTILYKNQTGMSGFSNNGIGKFSQLEVSYSPEILTSDSITKSIRKYLIKESPFKNQQKPINRTPTELIVIKYDC